jgi:choline dehydrogenase
LSYPIGDFNGPIQSVSELTQKTRDGDRCSVSKAYLEPNVLRPNLHIISNACVRKVLFNQQKRATGVEFDRFSGRYAVNAGEEIILSAGSINCPKI